MYVVYNALLVLLSVVLIPVLAYRIIVKGKYRTGLAERMGFIHFTEEELACRWLWIHAVSVGEVQVTIPLIKRIKERNRHLRVLLTTTTDTGQAIAHKAGADRVAYFPCDLPGNAARVFNKLNLSACLLTETEIWPNFLFSASKRGLHVALINGRISTKSYNSYRIGGFFSSRILDSLGLLCMQSIEDAHRIENIGASPSKIHVTGNLKFDRALEMMKGSSRDLRRELGIPTTRPVLLAGSVHGKEGEILIEAYGELRKTHPDLVLVIAPRHLTMIDSLEHIAEQEGLRHIKKTVLVENIRAACEAGTEAFSFEVVLLDTMGELAELYAASDIAFVGGSLIPHGGQNVLEPASFGKPVIFGPYTDNFKDSVSLLLAHDGAIRIADQKQLVSTIRALLEDPERAATMGAKAEAAVKSSIGATEKTYQLLNDNGYL